MEYPPLLGPDSTAAVGPVSSAVNTHFTEDGHLLTHWHLPAVRGTVEMQGSVPSDIAVDGRGHVFVADTGRARVLVFSSTGKLLRTW